MSDGSEGKKTLTPEELKSLVTKRAYAIYLERGADDGDPLGDWLAAESAVLAELNAAPAPSAVASPVTAAEIPTEALPKKAATRKKTTTSSEPKQTTSSARRPRKSIE
jgi:hypothetical protein